MKQLLIAFLHKIIFVISTMSLSNGRNLKPFIFLLLETLKNLNMSFRYRRFMAVEKSYRNKKFLRTIEITNVIYKMSFLLIPFLFINCSATVDPADVKIGFKIQIDSIKVADTVSLSDSVSIKFYGTVGPDGCHKFKMFDVVKGTNETGITVWGEKPNYDAICPAVMVYLNGKELKLKLTQTGNHTFKIHQPNGTVLTKSIIVK